MRVAAQRVETMACVRIAARDRSPSQRSTTQTAPAFEARRDRSTQLISILEHP
jgi:hypothetical protein